MNSYQKWLRGSSKNNPDLEVMQKKTPCNGCFFVYYSSIIKYQRDYLISIIFLVITSVFVVVDISILQK
jgi:hypothetical protein